MISSTKPSNFVEFKIKNFQGSLEYFQRFLSLFNDVLSVVSDILKKHFCDFSWKTIALIHYHLVFLTLNQENVFSRSNDVTVPYLLLSDITPSSILIKNAVLYVPHVVSYVTLVYKRFYHLALNSKQKIFLRFWWRHNDVTSAQTKSTIG